MEEKKKRDICVISKVRRVRGDSDCSFEWVSHEIKLKGKMLLGLGY